MHVLITGAAGMLGAKLAQRLADHGRLAGGDITRLTLFDVVDPIMPEGSTREVVAFSADLAAPGVADRLVADRPHAIFHLAAVVSGAAEADFETGYRVNLDGTLRLLEAIRQKWREAEYRPRFVFASSLAVFGGPMPEVLGDEYLATPTTSYGTQKALAELLLADYSRRGFIDGIALRLPTICIRPGRPNKAASGFFSAILREPLKGMEATLPVPRSTRHWFASPRIAVGHLVHAANIDMAPLGWRRSLNLPGLSATVDEQIQALQRAAGRQATGLIREEPDEAVRAIVASWPRAFDASRARDLGFVADHSMDDIIAAYLEDEINGRIAA